MTDAPTCRYIKDGGDRCEVTGGLSDDGLCLWHDPARSDKAKAARRRGGQVTGGRNRKVPRTVDIDDVPEGPYTLDDCAVWLRWLSRCLVTGRLDAKTCREATNAVKELRGTLEKLDLAKRLEAVEAELRKANMKAS